MTANIVKSEKMRNNMSSGGRTYIFYELLLLPLFPPKKLNVNLTTNKEIRS